MENDFLKTVCWGAMVDVAQNQGGKDVVGDGLNLMLMVKAKEKN